MAASCRIRDRPGTEPRSTTGIRESSRAPADPRPMATRPESAGTVPRRQQMSRLCDSRTMSGTAGCSAGRDSRRRLRSGLHIQKSSAIRTVLIDRGGRDHTGQAQTPKHRGRDPMPPCLRSMRRGTLPHNHQRPSTPASAAVFGRIRMASAEARPQRAMSRRVPPSAKKIAVVHAAATGTSDIG